MLDFFEPEGDTPFVMSMRSDLDELNSLEVAQFLVLEAMKNPRQIARLCLHRSAKDTVQMMMIGLAPNAVFPVHKHLVKSEFLMHLWGSGEIWVKEDTDFSSPVTHNFVGNAICPIPAGKWHAVKAGRKRLALIEITSGPFDPEDTIFFEERSRP